MSSQRRDYSGLTGLKRSKYARQGSFAFHSTCKNRLHQTVKAYLKKGIMRLMKQPVRGLNVLKGHIKGTTDTLQNSLHY
jgi:hypothetical protein